MPVPPPEVTILRALIASETGFVSGTLLAEQLGVSRVSVWSCMERMRAEGFVFEAARRKGYRLSSSPRQVHPWLLQAQLPSRKTIDLIWAREADSTNSVAERELAAGRAAPFIVGANRQTAGRGRFGRTWRSDDEANLYLSFAFRPRLEPTQLQTFTLWMGVNMCDCVANVCHLQPAVKWPNDLLHQGKKLGGMLTEARIDADHTRDLIFGLGLNINTDTRRWPEDLRRTATSLREAAGAEIDANHLAAAAVSRVLAAYDRFVSGEHLVGFWEAWRRVDALAGRQVAVQQGTSSVHGLAEGIDADGSLLVRTSDNTLRRFRAGEVTLSQR